RLFEKDQSVGGRVRDYWLDGERIALGAFLFSRHYSSLLALIREMGLEAKIRPTGGKHAIFSRRRIIKLDPASIIFGTKIPLRVKIDLARVGNLIAKLTPDSLPEELFRISLKDYFLARYRPEIVDDFVNPFCWGFFSSSAEKVLAANGLRAMSAPYHSYTLEGGLHSLIRAMESRLAAHVLKGCKIEGVAIDGNGGFVLRWGANSERFGIVACCTPIPEARKILHDVAIPEVHYSRKTMYVVKGQSAFPGISLLVNGDPEFRLGLIKYYRGLGTVSSEQGDPDLSPFFKDAEIVHEHTWEQCAPKGTRGEILQGPKTEIPNLYVGGDFKYGGGTESATRAGKEIAEEILGGLAGTS
ncbi:MAG: FAD-dependent oxidoreductase, partial [Betaproteobacteria bacterium]|nr:FAD-dependent oxidoreductase [Betaproteobacteria bacterium]